MKICFYGHLAEAIGRSVELPIGAGQTVTDVRRRLIALYPAAAEALARPAAGAWLDDRLVDEEAVISEGAELAFLPPLSGG